MVVYGRLRTDSLFEGVANPSCSLDVVRTDQFRDRFGHGAQIAVVREHDNHVKAPTEGCAHSRNGKLDVNALLDRWLLRIAGRVTERAGPGHDDPRAFGFPRRGLATVCCVADSVPSRRWLSAEDLDSDQLGIRASVVCRCKQAAESERPKVAVP